jgi:hypothetical protein
MEYNEKFMDNQRVMRGGSCVSPKRSYSFELSQFLAPGNKISIYRDKACKMTKETLREEVIRLFIHNAWEE